MCTDNCSHGHDHSHDGHDHGHTPAVIPVDEALVLTTTLVGNFWTAYDAFRASQQKFQTELNGRGRKAREAVFQRHAAKAGDTVIGAVHALESILVLYYAVSEGGKPSNALADGLATMPVPEFRARVQQAHDSDRTVKADIETLQRIFEDIGIVVIADNELLAVRDAFSSVE